MAITNIHDPEIGCIYVNEKSQLAPPTIIPGRSTPRTLFKMPQLRSCLVTIFIAAFLTIAYASAVPRALPDVQVPPQHEEGSFQQLLDQASDSALHGVLHKYVTYKYKHGVFPEDRKAIEAIHKDNPEAAISLVKLARRQASNATTTAVAADTTTSQQASQADTTQAQTSAPATPAAQQTTAQQGTTTAAAVNPITTAAPITSTLANGQATTIPASTVPVTGPASTSLLAGLSTNSIGSTVNAAGSTITSAIVAATTSPTRTITGSSKSVQVVYTTTLPNGARSTVTYVTVIPASEQPTTPGVTATGSASLQNGAQSQKNCGNKWLGLGLVGALAAVAV